MTTSALSPVLRVCRGDVVIAPCIFKISAFEENEPGTAFLPFPVFFIS